MHFIRLYACTVNFLEILLFRKSTLNKLKYFRSFIIHSSNFKLSENAWFSEKIEIQFYSCTKLQLEYQWCIFKKVEINCWIHMGTLYFTVCTTQQKFPNTLLSIKWDTRYTVHFLINSTIKCVFHSKIARVICQYY